MDENHTKFYPPYYDKNTTEKEVDFSSPVSTFNLFILWLGENYLALQETQLLMKDIKHYLKFALGIYGWPIYVYMKPIVGSACLCANMKWVKLYFIV